ncbi:hypothetical protein SASPL_108582 [Salvia splendens]|uniref:HAT C-terminal dimerisation domain-containing protein n=1 Tax=Salvia splendens TaxID=180675 RepID=A0A8X9A6B9_SALSN|nr:hypothetical protein SASPL_108582 [Salvia splendens]
MVDCGSSTQAQPSNILGPDFEMLEDIEIQEMENVIAKEAKKRKVQKGKCNRCEKSIAADPKLKGTTTMWKHHQSCSKKHTATQEQTMLNQEMMAVLDEWGLHRLMCCTIENATSNNVAIRHLKSKPLDNNMISAGMPIRRVGEAVRWINGSPTRSDSFKDITTLLKKKHNKQSLGLPKEEDWIEVKKICGYLEKFYDLTVEIVVDHTPAPASPTSMANPSDNLRFLEQGLCSQLHIIEEDDAWWKKHVGRYLIMSEMAKDIMAIPISSVASEAAFSTRGRVLSQFISSLTPNMVGALICAED